MRDLEELQRRIITFRDARDWKQFHNPKDLSVALSLEASEVLEHFLWKTEAEIKNHLTQHKADVAEELADVLWWTLILSNDLEVDLLEALDKKIAKNEVRYSVKKAKGNHKKYTELAE